MSSNESSSSSARPGEPGGEKRRGSVAALALSLGLLALLAWAFLPARSRFQPAPLHPVPPGCPKNLPDFVPSDATSVPGVDLTPFSKAQRNHVLFRLNMEPCPCGCNVSIATCRISHPACAACNESIEKILAEERKGAASSPGN